MADDVSISKHFWAEGVVVPWGGVWSHHLDHAQSVGRDGELEPPKVELDVTLQLRWYCSQQLGVPDRPFEVFRRQRSDDEPPWNGEIPGLPFDIGRHVGPVGASASLVEVDVVAFDQSQPVVLFGYAVAAEGPALVAMARRPNPGAGTVRLRIEAGCIDWIVVMNASSVPSGRFVALDATLFDDSWQLWEIVGLPIPVGGYAETEQGPVGDPVTGEEAAFRRLEQGLPRLGWMRFTQDGRLAPDHRPTDPGAMLSEVAQMLPQVGAVWTVPHHQQADLAPIIAEDTVGQGDLTVDIDASQAIGPLHAVLLATAADAAASLALGFGTARTLDGVEAIRPNHDYMVRAVYDAGGVGELDRRAYVPRPQIHERLARAVDLRADRMGLHQPVERNAPWRETNQVSWAPTVGSIALGRHTGSALVRHPAGDPDSPVDLTPISEVGPTRHLPMVPERATDQDPAVADRAVLVDETRQVAEGEGPSLHHYAVGLVDNYGVWSRWSDTDFVSSGLPEPGPGLNRLDATARHDDSPLCPTSTRVEVSLDWATRTWGEVVVHLLFVPSGTPVSPFAPPAVAPPGSVSRIVTFDPSAPGGATGGVVDEVDPDTGESVGSPGDAGEPRRYDIAVDEPILDFTTVDEWEVRCWAMATHGDPATGSPWVDPLSQPIPSPVPAPLPPPPPPVGVPTGSLPGSDGRSHVAVVWDTGSVAKVASVSIWEASETDLRAAVPGLGFDVTPGTAPFERLAALQAGYEQLDRPARRRIFTRLFDAPPAVGSADVALPRGSTDIHLYVVATRTPSGVESAVPTDWESVQPFMAPRVERAVTPTLSASVDATGNVRFEVTAVVRPEAPLTGPRENLASVPVDRFRIYPADPSDLGAPPAAGGPPLHTLTATANARGFEASWTGPAEVSWSPLTYRAVAEPPVTVPLQGMRPRPSLPSAAVSFVNRPDGPPELDPLTVGTPVPRTPSERVVPVFGGIDVLSTGAGPDYRISAVVDGVASEWTDLRSLPTNPPTAASIAPGAAVVARGSVAADGTTPLSVWFLQHADDPVDVQLRVTDPIGRPASVSVTIESFSIPVPLLVVDDLQVGNVFAPSSVSIVTDLDAVDFEDLSLLVVVQPLRGRGNGGNQGRPQRLLVRLDDIPVVLGTPRAARGRIVVARDPRGPRRMSRFGAWFFSTRRVGVRASIVDPRGRTLVTDSVGFDDRPILDPRFPFRPPPR